VFGESAGSASVSFHLVSPLSQGLFRSAICQSGSSLDSWAVVENPDEVAKRFAKKVNCSTTSSEEMVECLKNKPAKDLIEVRLQV